MPAWTPDPAQQRLWLGSNRYCSGRRDAGTNTKCLAYSCVKRYPLRGYESDSDANCDGNIHRNGHGYGYSNAQTDAHAALRAFAEASSDTAAQAVTVFTKANIVASGDK